MLDKKDPKQSIDLSDLGGRQISHPVVSGTPSKSIDLADLGGKPLDGHVVSEQSKDAPI
jgi:hypothetical protein